LVLRFGDPEAMLGLVERIAHRQDFGNLLAEGALRAARQIGRGTERYAMQVKGQEIPMHEPRIKFGLDIGYATSPTGADHNHSIHDTAYTSDGLAFQAMHSLGIPHPLSWDDLGPEKVRLAKYDMTWRAFRNCLVMCSFMPYHPNQVCDLVRAVTGWNATVFEFMKAGERALALGRAFNYREGFIAKDDVTHWRFSTAFESGPTRGIRVPDDKIRLALELYYGMNGWDPETGAPTATRLHELGLSWVAELLYGSGSQMVPGSLDGQVR
jgi:aldehyde:ferredoxin oxidoreductase